MFLNFSHHPSAAWCAEQRRASEAIAQPVQDVEFPDVPPAMSSREVYNLAAGLSRDALARGARAALVQGEMTLTYALVRLLEAQGVPCYAATAKRVAWVEQQGGLSRKTSMFQFAGFRRYPEDLFRGKNVSR